jgi:beta-N-acetylhexosaminidase
VIGTELASVGINQNYAPVADVNINPANAVIGVRSVGENPDLVSELVAAQVDGYHDGGVAAVAKHFPGHGDTSVDSHFGLPEVTHTREQLEAIDLPPFRAAIEEGVDTVMTAHVVLRSVDPSGEPATMSERILTGSCGRSSATTVSSSPTRSTWAGSTHLLRDIRLHAGFDGVADAGSLRRK